MGRQVKMDCQRLPVPFIYTGNSIYTCTTTDPPWAGEGDCRGIRKILRRGEWAGEKTHRLYCIVNLGLTGNFDYFSINCGYSLEYSRRSCK